jgi:SNF2 family DNA or RNA helicase
MQTITTLLPHQSEAVQKLSRLRVGALFMDMGTGKSRTAIELVARRGSKISRVIWLCPVSLKETIRQQIETHCQDTSVSVFDEHTRQGHIPDAFWYIVGLESLSASRRVVLAVNSLVDSHTMLIVDESSYIKGAYTSRTKWATRLGQRARYRLILTGTPVTQGVQDLYAQMRFLSPDILGYASYYSFARNHLEYSERFKGMIVRAHNTDYIAAKIAPFVYQVRKDECLTLPPKLYETRSAVMTDAQRELYQQATETILASAETWQEETGVLIYRLFGALQQVTCGFWREYSLSGLPVLHTVPHNRLSVLTGTLQDIPRDDKVIIWTKYRRCVAEIAAMLRDEFGSDAALFYGDLSEKERAASLLQFRGQSRVLVATESCGGHGLTLTEASCAVFYTNGFKYSDRIQAEDRNHRIGQTVPVTYVDIVCPGSIDERIADALARKKSLADEFRKSVQGVRDTKSVVSALRALVALKGETHD